MIRHTPRGVPYPDGDERVMDGDDAIAAAVQTSENTLQVARGTCVFTNAATAQVTLTWPAGFTAAPAAVAGCTSATFVVGAVANATSVTINASTRTGANTTVNLAVTAIAVGPVNPTTREQTQP